MNGNQAEIQRPLLVLPIETDLTEDLWRGFHRQYSPRELLSGYMIGYQVMRAFYRIGIKRAQAEDRNTPEFIAGLKCIMSPDLVIGADNLLGITGDYGAFIRHPLERAARAWQQAGGSPDSPEARQKLSEHIKSQVGSLVRAFIPKHQWPDSPLEARHVDEAFDIVEHCFSFLGLVDRFEESLALLVQKFELSPKNFLDVGLHQTTPPVFSWSREELLEEVERENPADIALYKKLSDKFEEQLATATSAYKEKFEFFKRVRESYKTLVGRGAMPAPEALAHLICVDDARRKIGLIGTKNHLDTHASLLRELNYTIVWTIDLSVHSALFDGSMERFRDLKPAMINEVPLIGISADAPFTIEPALRQLGSTRGQVLYLVD